MSSSDSASNGSSTSPLHSIVTVSSSVQIENPSTSSPICSPRSCSSVSPRSSPILNFSQIIKTKESKIYKPKFHTTRQNINTDTVPHAKQLQKRIERIITDNQTIIEKLDPRLQRLIHRESNMKSCEKTELQKKDFINDSNKFVCSVCHSICDDSDNRERCKDLCCKKCISLGLNAKKISQNVANVDFSNDYNHNLKSERLILHEKEYFNVTAIQPMSSPGPLLGSTRLVESQSNPIFIKRPRLETSVELSSSNESSKFSLPNTVQMFGGEVRIIDKSGECKTMRIENRTNSNQNESNCNSDSETASIVVRSSLHSGGTMLHKSANITTSVPQMDKACSGLSLANIVPNISTPSLAPIIPCFKYLKPTNIVHAGKLIPYVPGIPGPQTLSMNFDSKTVESINNKTNKNDIESQSVITTSINECFNSTLITKFLRPCSLPLKPGTFTPKCHHGITPTTNTLSLISPETPRSKKSYGQLYLNGHAYTYLGLKCSTRLFYCTLNRTQPMYVTQQNGLSMYSNWKICKESPPYLELGQYDSRHRYTGYTLANSRHKDIVTHSSRFFNRLDDSDSNFEKDDQESYHYFEPQNKIENLEDYIYISGKSIKIILI